MKINRIVLHNFGSYEGKNIIDTNTSKDKNIVLIGGKNGAGKTTLFTAIRLCLYGHLSMGYKNANSFYNRAIIKLINNNAKLNNPILASVSMQITISNGQELDVYDLSRNWELSDTLAENFTVYKNDILLEEEKVDDFEKYILSIIPPELFNLYFFDGEKISDFFLEQGSNIRIKNAFLTLCGYDTFEIMKRNFKRISANHKGGVSELDNYLETQKALEEMKCIYENTLNNIYELKKQISDCEAEIEQLDKIYKKRGGITQEELSKKLFILKQEEKKREQWNSDIRKWSNDIIPFLMVKDQLTDIKNQIDTENEYIKYSNFMEVLESGIVSKIIESYSSDSIALYKEIENYVEKECTKNNEQILGLSFEQTITLYSIIDRILTFEENEIGLTKRRIKRSIRRSAKIRNDLENSNINKVAEYLDNKNSLLQQKNDFLEKMETLQQTSLIQYEKLTKIQDSFNKAKDILTAELKKASINDISTRAIIMLDNLQEILYKKQIEKVESVFKDIICFLVRKQNFIDDIYIDDNFNINLYRNQSFKYKDIISILNANTEKQVVSVIGEKAFKKIKNLANSDDINKIITYLSKDINKDITLPREIDKSSFSNGEKQIFIMALYYSLVQLCSHEIPFIIDTPFARIDTEHRNNISQNFFRKLNGQVFILSTNEEINSSHINILQDKIAVKYMLNNINNNKTTAVKNTYFEV